MGFLAPCINNSCSTTDQQTAERVTQTLCLEGDPPVVLPPFLNLNNATVPTSNGSHAHRLPLIIGGTFVGVFGLLLLFSLICGLSWLRKRAKSQVVKRKDPDLRDEWIDMGS